MQDDAGRGQVGAVETLGRDAASRKRFLRMAGGSAIAAALAGAMSACGSGSEAGGAASGGKLQSSAGGDIDIVNFALTLEYIEADFYNRVLDSGLFSGRPEEDLLTTLRDNEQEHVRALRSMAEEIGGTPAPRPTTNFPLDRGREGVLRLAASLENTGAAAYLGLVAEIASEEVLVAALSIHAVEGRHAAALNHLIGARLSPDGFLAAPIDRNEALRRVDPFLV